MWSIKFALPALTLEAGALAALFGRPAGEATLATVLGMHAAASLLAALLVAALIPARYASPKAPLVALLFGANYALPVIGFFATLAGVAVLRRLPATTATHAPRTVELPPVDTQQRHGGSFRQTGLGTFLHNRLAPVGTRLKALIALQAVPGRVASPLLRGVLADPSEDIRLLAYGMLDSQEKRLNGEIHLARQRHAASEPASAERRAAAMRLSDLYWELIYQALVSGDLHRHACEESLRYAREALGTAAGEGAPDPALILRLGRLLHETGDHAGAGDAYRKALRLGLPAPRVAPYLAELAFAGRDYASVRRLMRELAAWPTQPRLAGPLAYWGAPSLGEVAAQQPEGRPPSAPARPPAAGASSLAEEAARQPGLPGNPALPPAANATPPAAGMPRSDRGAIQ